MCIPTTRVPSTRHRKEWRARLTTHAWCTGSGKSWRMLLGACSTCVFVVRLRALELGLGLYVSRVPTHEHISDKPSREDYGVLERMGAVRVRPHLSHHFRQALAREALSIRQRRVDTCMVASATVGAGDVGVSVDGV